MNKRRTCKNFTWRDDDPEWIAERRNDRTVFRKIRRETAKGRSAEKVIAALFSHAIWSRRMSSKRPKSWKDCYHRWRKKCLSRTRFGYDVQAKKSSFDPCKHWSKFIAGRFYREKILLFSSKPR